MDPDISQLSCILLERLGVYRNVGNSLRNMTREMLFPIKTGS